MIYSEEKMEKRKKGCLLALGATFAVWAVLLLAGYGLYGLVTHLLGVGTWNW